MCRVDVILSTIEQGKKPREDGSVMRWNKVQGVLTGIDGRQQMFDHSIFPPRDHQGEFFALKPGPYEVSADVTVDYKTKNLQASRFVFTLVGKS